MNEPLILKCKGPFTLNEIESEIFFLSFEFPNKSTESDVTLTFVQFYCNSIGEISNSATEQYSINPSVYVRLLFTGNLKKLTILKVDQNRLLELTPYIGK